MEREPGVDITNIISDLQKLVVSLKDDSETTRVLNKVVSVRDVIKQRNDGMLSLKPKAPLAGQFQPQDRLDLEKPNTNYQLQELDAENLRLRELYEESMWTMELVMRQHREEMVRPVKYRRPPPMEENTTQGELKKDGLNDPFIDLVAALDQMMRREDEKYRNMQKSIKELTTQNLILREILSSNKDVDVESILERVENRTPQATPNTSVIYNGPIQSTTHDPETPKKSAELKQ